MQPQALNVSAGFAGMILELVCGRKVEKAKGEAFDWLRQQSRRALAELRKTFVLDQTTGTPEVNRYYPRIIRAFDDAWSTKGSQALYTSPIARLVWSYVIG